MLCAASLLGAYDSCVLVDDGSGTDWVSDYPAPHCRRSIDEITGLEFHHLMRSATRGTEHENVIFLKELEATSTRFWDAYNSFQILPRVTFSFFDPDPSGRLVLHHQVILERVRVLAIELIDIEPTDGGGPRQPPRERIRLEYGTITIDVDGQSRTLTNPSGPQV
ncbi:MAG: type VI secretion system tube protein Hcp [Acidobacteriota bacterium]|nr:type VI secretion system tube protein Hcp [Acidobacteriota bacterium]